MRCALLAATALVSGAVGRQSAASRKTVNFNPGWLNIVGEQPFYNNSGFCDFPINYTGLQCSGLNQAAATTLDDCAQTCCNDWSCEVYQFCAAGEFCGGSTAPTASCWVGSVSTCSNSSGWVSYGRDASTLPNAPPTPGPQPCPASPACAGYDDSSWRSLSVPHDFVVEGQYSPTADRGHGYLPFNISYYRKHFSVDAAWEGSVLWIDFDGVYRASDYWLNGVYLGHAESGYVAFRWYLHNVTDPATGKPALQYGPGATNVLAVRVDAQSHQEGWFYEGGGIYRDVSITAAPRTYVVPWGVYAPSFPTGVISSPQGTDGPQTSSSALVNVFTDVSNTDTSAVSYTLVTSVVDASGVVLSSTSSSGQLDAATGWARVSQSITLNSPVNLWNAESPYLHTVVSNLTTITSGTAVVSNDVVTTTIGIRRAVFSADNGLLVS